MARLVGYEPEHLQGILALCTAEGWPSLAADPERAQRVLTAPGVTTVVAVDDGGEVLGFAQLLSDGEIQACLLLLAVDARHRRAGVATSLVSEGLRRAGGERIDLLSEDGAVEFYKALPHQRKPGFRLYPHIP
jgi:ribosomal protein S18 acetylase RimI-like enzyme